MVTVTELKKATGTLVGMTVPKQKHGNIGRIVESSMMDDGYILNDKVGPDLPGLGVEVKSRIHGSNSAHSVGAMTLTAINSTDWEDSPVCAKIQQQFRVMVDNSANVITSAKMYDFRDQEIQRRLKHAYESGRAIINDALVAKQELPAYIRGKGAIAYWECKSGDSYGFRIGHSSMKILESMSINHKTFSKLFSYT